jgi:protein tyrosine phosphatase (PTP) superfamily phosphohydrolase (DUF442 family)
MRYGSILIILAAIGCQNSDPKNGDHEAKTEPQPEGDAAFANLAAMGVTTVISVDGAATDIETAHKYGIRYAHCPIGYDSVPRDQALLMIRAAENSKGAVYVHCHHGKHRGPAGMMAIRITLEDVSNDVAVEALKTSGTSPKYTGLYKDIAEFKAPTAEEMAKVPATVPERVMPAGMRATMVSVSHRWEFLASSRKQEWGVPKESPDVSPPHEARMLWELYRETARNGDLKKYGDDFKEYLVEGEKAAIDLEKALRAKDLVAAEKHYKAVKSNCNSCHSQYRN